MLRAHATGMLIAALVMTAVAPTYLGAAEAGAAAESRTPSEVAEYFLKAFVQKDLDAVVALFAAGALVQRARLTDGGEPELAQFDALEWVAGAGQGISGIQDFKIEILESKAVAFDDGTTVSVRFRATGRAGEVSFVNNGVDSFSMTQVDGQWRILLYNSMEKFGIDE